MRADTQHILVLVLLSQLCFTTILCLRGRHAYKSYKKTKEEFILWKEANPAVYIGLSETGKRLLHNLILSHDRYYELVPFVKDEAYRNHLMSLFDEVPPRPHKPNPTKETEPLQNGVVFSCKMHNIVVELPHICQTQT